MLCVRDWPYELEQRPANMSANEIWVKQATILLHQCKGHHSAGIDDLRKQNYMDAVERLTKALQLAREAAEMMEKASDSPHSKHKLKLQMDSTSSTEDADMAPPSQGALCNVLQALVDLLLIDESLCSKFVEVVYRLQSFVQRFTLESYSVMITTLWTTSPAFHLHW
eukprot:1269250-Amphidinium_carterae.1